MMNYLHLNKLHVMQFLGKREFISLELCYIHTPISCKFSPSLCSPALFGSFSKCFLFPCIVWFLLSIRRVHDGIPRALHDLHPINAPYTMQEIIPSTFLHSFHTLSQIFFFFFFFFFFFEGLYF